METIPKKKKRELAENQKSVININEYIRFVVHSDGQKELQKRNIYTDKSDAWVFKGWYADNSALVKGARSLIEDKKIKEREVGDLTYFIKCFKEADVEIKDFFKL